MKPLTRRILEDCGWFPGRSIPIRDNWILPLEGEGYQPFAAAELILQEFGGLILPPLENHGRRFGGIEIEPLVSGVGEYDRFEEYEILAGESLFPIGQIFGYRIFMIGRSGSVYVGDTGKCRRLSSTFLEALDLVIGGELSTDLLKWLGKLW